MDGANHHQHGHQRHKIVVVLVSGFIKKEDVNKTKGEQDAAKAIKRTEHDSRGRQQGDHKVQMHSTTGPTRVPVPTKIRKQIGWLVIVVSDLVVDNVVGGPVDHHRAKRNSEECNRTTVNAFCEILEY